jgi:hypothetical protein
VIPAIRVDAQALQASFRVDSAAMAALLKGPVMANLTKRALRVEAAAKENASGRGGPGPKVRTGRLRASITWRPGADSISPYVDIGSAVLYSAWVELGHRNTPHVFPINTPGGKFTGQFGYVSAKPTRPFPYLRPSLLAARSV